MSPRRRKLGNAHNKSVSTMITTREKRELLRHYELLSDQERERMRNHGGLLGSIDLLQTLLRLFWDLKTRLEQLDEEHNPLVSEINKLPKCETVWPDVATSELMVATLALEEVLKTIGERGLASQALERLHNALLALVHDAASPGMLTPTEQTSRPVDAPAVQAAKGMLAAALHVQQKMRSASRNEAAGWVVKHASPELMRRLSRKPITSRTVIEWLDRFGGKHATGGFGRDAFLSWSKIFERWSARKPITGQELKAVTETHSRGLPELAA